MLCLKNVKAAIFDIDGTLLDSMPIWKDICGRYLKSIGVEPEANLGDIVFTMTIKEGVKYSKSHYNLTQSEEEIEAGVINMIKDFYYYEAPAKEGVVELVRRLYEKGVPMMLATTGDKSLATRALERIGIMECFGELLSCNEYNTNKGEADIFMMAADKMSANAEDIWVFEDSLKAITTVKKAGFHAIGIRDQECKADWPQIEALADYTVDSLKEITIE